MYVNCVSEEAVNRQHRIEDCLLDMMLETPYKAISVSDLCQTAKCSRKAFYRYFTNKDGCLIALMDRTFLNFAYFEVDIACTNPDTPPELWMWLAYWTSQKKLLDALVKNNLGAQLIERGIYYGAKVDSGAPVGLGMSVNEMDEDVLHFLNSGLISLILRWHSADYPKTFEQMVDTATRLLMSPLVPQKPEGHI